MLYPEEQGLYTILVAHQRIRHAVSRSTNTQRCQGDTLVNRYFHTNNYMCNRAENIIVLAHDDCLTFPGLH